MYYLFIGPEKGEMSGEYGEGKMSGLREIFHILMII